MKGGNENHHVFIISVTITALLAAGALLFKNSFTTVMNGVSGFLIDYFSWFYVAAMIVFVVFSVSIACSRYGTIKLGPDESEPEYSTASWFAMLFGAGMGVGLVFWGVSEPISHFAAPPDGLAGGTQGAADFAMRTTFMHWGIHPWASYCIIGLALGYFQFRKNRPGLLSSIFSKCQKDSPKQGCLGNLIDVLAILATVGGIITSLGLGVRQINSGLHYLFGVQENLKIQILIMTVLTVIILMVALSGLEKGVKRISDLNLCLAFALMAAMIIVGPGVGMMNNLVNGLGQYISNFIQDSFRAPVFGNGQWIADWRIFYWAWWIAWAPFVGSFIGRISRGRTIRQFILGAMLAPAGGSALWFAVFGTLGINLGVEGVLSMDQLRGIAAAPETGLFLVLGEYPFGKILALVSLVLLCTFFIISANSGTFVLSMMSSGGNMNPRGSMKVLWGIALAVLAVGVLFCGLKPLPIVAIAAFPFIIIMLCTCAAMLKSLKQEKL